jgi:hypothetical protein
MLLTEAGETVGRPDRDSDVALTLAPEVSVSVADHAGVGTLGDRVDEQSLGQRPTRLAVRCRSDRGSLGRGVVAEAGLAQEVAADATRTARRIVRSRHAGDLVTPVRTSGRYGDLSL